MRLGRKERVRDRERGKKQNKTNIVTYSRFITRNNGVTRVQDGKQVEGEEDGKEEDEVGAKVFRLSLRPSVSRDDFGEYAARCSNNNNNNNNDNNLTLSPPKCTGDLEKGRHAERRSFQTADNKSIAVNVGEPDLPFPARAV